MKLRAKLFSIFFISLMLFSRTFANSNSLNGIELCDSINQSLKKSGFSLSTQSLVASGENYFPYNNLIKIKGQDENTSETLVFVFFQEDAANYSDLIKEVTKELTAKSYPFNITILLAYGEKQKIQKLDMIYGTQVFVESLNSNHNYTTIIFDFDNDSYGIETSSLGQFSPSWLIQNSCNTLMEADIGAKLPLFYLSQVLSNKFAKNRTLSTFFKNEIPAIILKLKKPDSDNSLTKEIILKSAQKFENTKNTNWDHHFMMIRLFGRYYTLSESAILRISIPVIFVWLLFIFLLFFINTRQKKRAWSRINKIWFSVPVIYIILNASFFLMRFWFTNTLSNLSSPAKIYGILTSQIIGALFISELFFILILSLNNNFEVKSTDYLLVICCFINQSIFILLDISLSPIFMTVCLLSLAALATKNNLLHILIFILMILILVPYGNAVINNSDLDLLSKVISTNNKMIYAISLALTPCFVILLRILTSIRSRRKSFSSIIAGTSISFSLIALFLILTCVIRTKQNYIKQVEAPGIEIGSEGPELIDISFSDTSIFGDTIRTLEINLKKECVICDVQINTQSQNPILYTDNDYSSNSENSIRFKIPDYPPSNLVFSYGANQVASKIIVSAVIEGSSDNNYKFISKTLQIGDM